MKTAISLPDNLFHEADALAKRLGVSRSELYASAVSEYLARRNRESITARVNAVYQQVPSPAAPELRASARAPVSRADLW